MKFVLILLAISSLSSCLMKKEDTQPKAGTALSQVSKGFFNVKDQLYYSDGIDLYCGFKDWDHLERLTKDLTKDQKLAIKLEKEPEMMKFVLHCKKEIIDGSHSSKQAVLRK